jgi:hypothetical protein
MLDGKSLEAFRRIMIESEQSRLDPFHPSYVNRTWNVERRWHGWTHNDLQVHAENIITIGIEGC